MSIHLRILQHYSAEEQRLLAKQLAAPAEAAMEQCSATKWDEASLADEGAPPPTSTVPTWHWLLDCTAAIGPGLAFRLGAMVVGPALIHHALTRFD